MGLSSVDLVKLQYPSKVNYDTSGCLNMEIKSMQATENI